MLQVPDLKTFTLGAGEPFLLEIEFQTATSVRIDVSDREYVMSVYGPGRLVDEKIDGELVTDTGGTFMRFARDGLFSEGLYGKPNLSIELAERFHNGRNIIATGKLTVAISAATVASYDNGPIGRQAIRAVVKDNAIPGGLATVSAHVVPYVDQVAPEISLTTLALSTTALTSGTSGTIAITGATDGSAITGTPPDGMTLDSAAREISGTPTTAGSYSLVLTEALAGTVNSPRQTTIDVTVAAAPVVTPTLPATVKITDEGDSITFGAGDTANEGGYPGRLLPLLTAGPAYTISNVATSGDTAANMDSNYDSEGVPASFDASKDLNILTLLASVNDGAVYNRIADYKHLRSIINNARKTGFQRVVIATLTGRASDPSQAPLGDSYFDATTLPLNQDIRALWDTELDADALSDFGNTAGVCLASDAAGPNFADKLHPSPSGYDIMAPVMAAAINKVVAGPGVRGKGPGTWSYMDKADSIALSDDHRTASATNSNYLNAALSGFPDVRSGKAGWEVSIDNSGFVEKGFDTVMLALNCRGSKYYQMGNSFGDDSDAYVSIKPNGDIQYNGGPVQGNIGALRTGSTVTFCVDMAGATKLLWVRRNNGPWNGSATADPATGVGGIDVNALYTVDVGLVGQRQAAFGMAARLYCTPAIVTSRFKAAEITVSLPAGFSAVA